MREPLIEVLDIVHAHHSRGMPMGYVASRHDCENPLCRAVRDAMKTTKEENSAS